MDSWLGAELNPISLNKYIYAANDPILFVDPSGNIFTISGLMAGINGRATLATTAQSSYRVTLKKIGKEFACIAVEELVSDLIMQQLTGGIYIALDGGSPYVGRTNDFDRRLMEHARDQTRKIERILARFHIDGDRNDMRVVEQFFMDLFREANQPTTNRINSIAQNPGSANSQRLRRMVNRLDFCD